MSARATRSAEILKVVQERVGSGATGQEIAQKASCPFDSNIVAVTLAGQWFFWRRWAEPIGSVVRLAQVAVSDPGSPLPAFPGRIR